MNAVNLSSHEHPVHVCVNERGSICLESFLFVFLGQKKKKKMGKKDFYATLMWTLQQAKIFSLFILAQSNFDTGKKWQFYCNVCDWQGSVLQSAQSTISTMHKKLLKDVSQIRHMLLTCKKKGLQAGRLWP